MSHSAAEEVAGLTFKLLNACQKKEALVARQLGITAAEFRVLHAFVTAPQLNIREIIQALNVTGTSFSKLARGLEKRGLLCRSIDPTDRRVVTVSLTNAGKKLVRNLKQRYSVAHQDLLSLMPKREHAALIESLRRLSQALDQWLREA